MFFRGRDNRIMVSKYAVTEDSFVADTPRVWSERQLMETGGFRNLDLAPDGGRFAVLTAAEGQQALRHVTFLLNFFDELRRRAPVGGE